MVAMLVRKTNLELRMLPDADKRKRVLLKLFTSRCEFRTRPGAAEKWSAELIFKALDAGRDGRLRNVHLTRRVDETSRLGNHQEGAREIDVHETHLIVETLQMTSIEIFDRGHRKNPFVAKFDSNQIVSVPIESARN